MGACCEKVNNQDYQDCNLCFEDKYHVMHIAITQWYFVGVTACY